MHHDPLPDDLLDVAQTLERQRPRLDGIELDELKRRTLRASRTTAPSMHKGPFMRTRLAITTLLASGVILSSGGTAIGVTALRQTDDAGVAQYGKPSVAPDETLGGTAGEGTGEGPGAVAGDETTENPGTSAEGGTAVQAARQVGTVSGDSLPFTGYAAIPVLLMGLALLAGGLVMRRRVA